MSRSLVVYTSLRLALIAAVASVLILARVPAAVAVLVAILVGFGLSLVLFRGLRARVEADLAVTSAQRRERREQLRSALRGTDSADAPGADSTGRVSHPNEGTGQRGGASDGTASQH